MSDWNRRTVGPAGRAASAPRVLRNPSFALFRLSAALGFAFGGIGTLYVGQYLFNLPDDFWRASDWGWREVAVLAASLVASLLGGLFGMACGASFQVEGEHTNDILDTLWHYLANTVVTWSFLVMLVLHHLHGQRGLEAFVDEVGQWRLAGVTFAVSAVGGLATATVLLLTGRLKPGVKVDFLASVVTALPITLLMGYIQFAVLRIDSWHWLSLGCLLPVAVVPLSAHLLKRDRAQRRRLGRDSDPAVSPEPTGARGTASTPAVLNFRPTLASFICSSAYRLSPALTACVLAYFMGGQLNTFMWIVTGVAIAAGVVFFLPCITVHLQRLSLDDEKIQVFYPAHTVAMRWSEVQSAVLHERENAVSRTDHMLVLRSPQQALVFHTSTLSPADEERALEVVREKTRLVVQKATSAV